LYFSFNRFAIHRRQKMIIARPAARSILAGLGILAGLAGYSVPARADVTVLRCIGGGKLLMAAIDLERNVFYLRHPFVGAWDVRVIGQLVYIRGIGRLSLAEGILEWGSDFYRCDMSPS
jgi:hypothetical protein